MNPIFDNFTEKIVTLQNTELHYLEMGEGQPLILLHGLGGSHHDWSENLPAFAEDYKVYVIDIPGFGSSPPPPIASIINQDTTYFTQLIDDFRKFIGHQQITIVGHSMGGGFALHYAHAYPQHIKGLILANSASIAKDVTWIIRLLAIPFIYNLSTNLLSQKSVDIIWQQFFYDKSFFDSERSQITFKWISKLPSQIFLKEFQKMVATLSGQNHVLGEKITEIECPILLFWGDKDNVIPVKHTSIAKSFNANIEVHIFKDCGHIPIIEKSEEFNQRSLNFLKSLE